MAHIPGNKTGVAEMKSATSAGAAKMMGSAMDGMSPMMNMGEGMMKSMGPMMNMGEGMMSGMGSMMGMGEGMMRGMGQAMNPGMTRVVARGVIVSAGSSTGKSVLRKIFMHPATLLGIGIVAGYLVHKYRKSIISTPDEA